MNTTQRLALVTGANRGIGLEVSRQLARQGLHVILTSRDEGQGQQAADGLAADGLAASYLPLDVTDGQRIERLAALVQREYGRLDVLVNNAGVYLDEGVSIFAVDEATIRETMEVNFFGALLLTRALVPLMRANRYGRIVNVSSGYGSMHEMGGYTGAYKISKVALNAMTRIMADELRRDNIKVNTMNPGWVRTAMGGPHAPRSPAEAADTIVWLATLPNDGPTGGFFADRRPAMW
ncbi:MAG: SDR family oxidoreductase [Chloroflexaceae bacterium]|jgi:NAD(P)-dependent dehydrogenase (short-subunit alcohol dehydrogenase family)|nr:SDR family oxidoreductase [Chloroflexaceae bacterium]